MLAQKKTPHKRIRPILIGLAALLVVPMLMTFFALSPTASAARARLDYSPYLTQVKQRSLALAMSNCISHRQGFDGGLTPARIASGDWGGSFTTVTTVGPVADGDDGQFSCKELVSATRDTFGYSSFTDMFCALKGEWRDDAGLDCISNITKGEYSGGRWNIPRDRGTYAIQVLEKKAGKSLKFDSALVNYSTAMAALLSAQNAGCKAEWRGYDSGDDAASNDIKADQRNKKIAVALTDSTAAYGYFYLPDAGKRVRMFHGADSPYGPSGGAKTEMSCAEIAQWASNNAEAAAKSAKTDSTESTRKAIRSALIKRCVQSRGGGPAQQICESQVDGWMNACKDKMPSSGNVANSSEYVDCLKKQSGYSEDDIKSSLSNITADTPSGQSDNGNDDRPDCAVKELGWLVCPVINFMARIADAAFAMIADNFLKIEPGLASGGEVQAAWGIMRNIANGAFIIMFLAIIISQLTGFGISNYGIKKMLPRLIIAAILVNLSIYICQIAVDLSNILGYGLRAGLGGIGDGISAANSVLKSGQGGETWGGIALTVLAGATAAVLALAVLIGALVSGLVVMVTIAALLIARKALIVILIVISPLAFVAFLLPNTEKFFSKWRSTFVGLLMVFPIVGLLFGGGILAGSIVKAGATDADNMVMQIVGELIKVLPLIAVWSVLKKAIDVAGAIGQHINNAGGSLGGSARNWAKDRYDSSRLGEMQKFRKQRRQRRKALMRAGAWEGTGALDKFWRNRKSRFSKRFNESALANNRFLGGDYGIRSAAEGQDAVDDEERKTAERMLDYRYNGDAAAALRGAGDNEILKHIAFKKLESTGKRGAEQMYEYLQGGGTISNRRMAETLTRMKDDHAGLFEMGRTAIDQMEQNGATSVSFSQQQMAELTAKGVSGLSDEKLARQTSSAIKIAGETEFTKGDHKMVGVSAERAASVLDNKRINTSISGSARKELENIRNSDRAAEPQELRVPHDMSGVTADDVKNAINSTVEINNITEAVPSDTPTGRTFVAGTGRGPAPPQSPPSALPDNQSNRDNRNNNPPATS
jgi:hypothetical protein cdiviTM7_02854